MGVLSIKVPIRKKSLETYLMILVYNIADLLSYLSWCWFLFLKFSILGYKTVLEKQLRYMFPISV